MIRNHSYQAHHGSPFANPNEQLGRHFLSKNNLSLQNLSSLGRLVDDRTGYHEDKRVSDEELNRIGKQKNGKELREYYEKLNEILDGWREVDEILDMERNQSTSTDRERQSKAAQLGGVSERDRMRLLQHVPGRQEREGEREKGVQFAININLAVNVLLLAGKAIAVVSSNSVSLIASLVDSALDLLSTVIIFGTSKAISYRSFHTYFKYPVGKKRFEPLGVVIFAVLMIASFCQVLVESIERLFAVMRTGTEAPGESAELPLIGIAFMVLTIIIKAFMWFIYRKSHSSGVRAVAQDAENDVVFNIASLIFPVVGSKLGWPALDPIGGVCLSIYIIAEWLETLTETVTKLSGAVGSSHDISRALYLILRFRSVNSVSALEVYHAGDDMIVEADVVLPHTMALKEAHDAGEVITYGMELLSGIERSYIHLDYNARGQAGHVAQRG
ncbi:uncharacterized protein FA14DRAFT_143465 [Meira miltonrushii]|uniref:Cation efflux protein transmembrane domain-containing protein n=1 Tax=Meira miltonrushii TaxID=1280837 RepID=A0A316VLL3_9BASI|nr:uncharacterized protein FA14DRAFT_143465 [Meira miltonrushii]PWN38407.1 hypothetical protein FA14DRAFT_143465 [Meira miltonrushii]